MCRDRRGGGGERNELRNGIGLGGLRGLGRLGRRTKLTLPNSVSVCLQGKVHGSLARAGKVKGQTPKVEKQEKKKKPTGTVNKETWAAHCAI